MLFISCSHRLDEKGAAELITSNLRTEVSGTFLLLRAMIVYHKSGEPPADSSAKGQLASSQGYFAGHGGGATRLIESKPLGFDSLLHMYQWNLMQDDTGQTIRIVRDTLTLHSLPVSTRLDDAFNWTNALYYLGILSASRQTGEIFANIVGGHWKTIRVPTIPVLYLFEVSRPYKSALKPLGLVLIRSSSPFRIMPLGSGVPDLRPIVPRPRFIFEYFGGTVGHISLKRVKSVRSDDSTAVIRAEFSFAWHPSYGLPVPDSLLLPVRFTPDDLAGLQKQVVGDLVQKISVDVTRNTLSVNTELEAIYRADRWEILAQ